MLGLNATLTLALSFSLVKSLRAGKPNGIDHPLYWRRALVAATAARALADAMRQPMAEEIFLAALLQDVGMLALDQAVPDLYRGGESLQRDHAALAEHERKRLQADHAEVGGWLMKAWNLPPRLYRAIEHSHHLDLHATTDPRRSSSAASRCPGRSPTCFCAIPRSASSPRRRCRAERGLAWTRWHSARCSATIGSMLPETEAIFETDPYWPTASRADPRAGARGADAAQSASRCARSTRCAAWPKSRQSVALNWKRKRVAMQ